MDEKRNKKERTVIHVFLKDYGTHHYFGSLANIFEHLSADEVGIVYGSLRNYGLSMQKPYENSKCIIRKGVLLAKSRNKSKRNVS